MTQEQRTKLEIIVRDYLMKNIKLIQLDKIKIDENVINHVIHTGIDLLSKKWGLQNNCGSFVQSILNNSLDETIGRADEINEHFIKFYVLLINNVRKPENI